MVTSALRIGFKVQRSEFYSIFAGIICCISLSCSAGESVQFGARFVDIEPAVPVYPIDREVCDSFRASKQDDLRYVNESHEQCLKERSGSKYSPSIEIDALTTNSRSRCSVPACQILHDGKDRLQRRVSDGYAQCISTVNEYQRQTFSNQSADRASDLASLGRELASGPVSAVKRYTRQAMSTAIQDVFGLTASSAKTALNASLGTAMLWKKTETILNVCKNRGGRVDVKSACVEEVRDSVTTLATKIPGAIPSDPAISTIQRTMLSRINQMQGEVIGSLDETLREIETSERSSNESESISTRARQPRRRPIIENN